MCVEKAVKRRVTGDYETDGEAYEDSERLADAYTLLCDDSPITEEFINQIKSDRVRVTGRGPTVLVEIFHGPVDDLDGIPAVDMECSTKGEVRCLYLTARLSCPA